MPDDSNVQSGLSTTGLGDLPPLFTSLASCCVMSGASWEKQHSYRMLVNIQFPWKDVPISITQIHVSVNCSCYQEYNPINIVTNMHDAIFTRLLTATQSIIIKRWEKSKQPLIRNLLNKILFIQWKPFFKRKFFSLLVSMCRMLVFYFIFVSYYIVVRTLNMISTLLTSCEVQSTILLTIGKMTYNRSLELTPLA